MKPKFFIWSIVIIELGTSAFLYAFGFLRNVCSGGPCKQFSFFNPFGIRTWNDFPGPCPMICASGPHPYFYLAADVTILTVVAVSLFGILRETKKSREALGES